jgi:4-diphosphocytidyl-2-C-methyl-D-erythritol kinase
MTGVGETLLPLALPKMPCVLVNPCVPVATKDVFAELGLRHGELRVGATDVILHDPVWPEAGASIDAWIKILAGIGNDLEKPAMRIHPVISEVLAVLRDTGGSLLARMSGSGATCFAIFGDDAGARRAARAIQREHPQWWVHAGELS